MNTERQQTYYNILQGILDCHRNGEVQEILKENEELVDAGLLQMVEATGIAAIFSQQKYEKELTNLQSASTYIRENLNLNIEVNILSLPKEQLEAYFKFLSQLLLSTLGSRGDEQTVNYLLVKNTDKLNGILAEVLRNWGTMTLNRSEENRAEIARNIALFSSIMAQFTVGERSNNIEVSIAGYEVILLVYTHATFPELWALTQRNLGVMYRDRIRGRKADNLEKSIAACNDALTVYTKEAFPKDWAAVKSNLGTVYLNRIEGNKKNNIEQSIAAYQEALNVYDCSNSAVEWAFIQSFLGHGYQKRVAEVKATNIELAIAAYKAALTVYNYETFPEDWARTKSNLANAYRNRILGDKAGNIELAIGICKEALTIRSETRYFLEWVKSSNILALLYCDRIIGDKTKNIEGSIAICQEVLATLNQDFSPFDWAMTQNNLGIAYHLRILGDKVKNIKKSIDAYNLALTVYTSDGFPEQWGITQYNLGSVYRDSLIEDNIEKSIIAYKAALTIYNYDSSPEGWAKIQYALGNSYIDRIIGEKSSNIELAIDALQAAMTVRTRQDFPENWARTKGALGNAYFSNVYFNVGERDKNIELAVNCYYEALEVLNRETFPLENVLHLYSLGSIYKETQRLQEAYDIFKTAIDNLNELRGEISSGEEAKRKQAEEWNKLYINMVKVCLELGRHTEAIEYAERSKTRNLIEQILENDFNTLFPPEVVTQLESYRDELAVGQFQIQYGKAENPEKLAQHLRYLRQQRNELQNRYLPVGSDFTFNQFQSTLNEHTVILQWHILDDRFLVFFVKSQEPLTVWQSQLEDAEALITWVNHYRQQYYSNKVIWQNTLRDELDKLASILHLDEILTHLPEHCDRLILIPHRWLHTLPLHALLVNQNPDDPCCLLDLFRGAITYSPSCQLLQLVQLRQRPNFQSLLAIQNPTEDLIYTDLEVQVIQSYFANSNILSRKAATLVAVNNSNLNHYHCIHFSCHGYFNLSNPIKSALFLANESLSDTTIESDPEIYLDKQLTLEKIFTLKLEKCRLVTLSACETGLTDIHNTSDEYIGLPSGFLLAGSPSIVSSLWEVNDLSTSFLLIQFYKNLVKLDHIETGDVAIAIKQAQTWLRDMTIGGLDSFLEEHKTDIEKVLTQLRPGQRASFNELLALARQRYPQPFANPYYWAGFTASGL